MARSTVHYADNKTNNTLKKLHNKLRPAGNPVQRVEYIIELLLLRIFEAKLKHDPEFQQLRPLFKGESESLLFSSLSAVPNEQILATLNTSLFPFYAAILSNARKVLKGNPSIKVQDQLVLIEEVFCNSNFTNNVNSGNLQEVINLVGDLNEERLLKTDLLGDAIAQKIEWAHLYSYKLSNYRSSLAAAQVQAWHDFAEERNGFVTPLDKGNPNCGPKGPGGFAVNLLPNINHFPKRRSMNNMNVSRPHHRRN